ncbi:MAG: FecR domain-containing protein [Defluviicoccus sp.]
MGANKRTVVRGLGAVSGWLVAVVLAAPPAGSVELKTIGETAARIGETSLVVQSVSGVLPAGRRALALADPVHSNEVIETGAESAGRFVLLDKTELATGANSRITLDQFVFASDPSGQKVAIGLTKGFMRFVTGSMDSKAYEVKTSDAVIGFRGTSVLIELKDDQAVEVWCIGGVAVQATAVAPDGTTTTLQCPVGSAISFSAGRALVCGPPSSGIQVNNANITATIAFFSDGPPADTFETVTSQQQAMTNAAQQAAASDVSTGASCNIGC